MESRLQSLILLILLIGADPSVGLITSCDDTKCVIKYMHIPRNAIFRTYFMSESADTLTLMNSHFSEIPLSIIKSLPNLETLNAEKCHILSVLTFAADNHKCLAKLETLNLKNNQVDQLQNGTFAGAKELLKLRLSHNRIDTIEISAFAGLSKLKELYLDHNKIETLDWSTISVMRSLSVLELGDNKLTSIGEISYQPEKLIHLDLMRNNLTAISGIEQLTSLEILKLSSNKELKFDPSLALADMSDLKELYIGEISESKMNFNQFPKLPTLEFLSVGHMKLDKVIGVSSAKKKFPKLSAIEIRHNNFSCSYLETMNNEFKSLAIDVLASYEHQSTSAKMIDGINCVDEKLPSTNDDYDYDSLESLEYATSESPNIISKQALVFSDSEKLDTENKNLKLSTSAVYPSPSQNDRVGQSHVPKIHKQDHDRQQEVNVDNEEDKNDGKNGDGEIRTFNSSTTTSQSLNDRDENNGSPNSTSNHKQDQDGQQEEIGDTADDQKAGNKEENPSTTTSQPLNDLDETNDQSNSTSNHNQEPEGQQESKSDAAGHEEKRTLNPTTTTSMSLNDRDETNGPSNLTRNHKQDHNGQQKEIGETADDQKAGNKEENPLTTTATSLNDRDETNGQPNSTSNRNQDHDGQQEEIDDTADDQKAGNKKENPLTTTSQPLNDRDETNGQPNSTSNRNQDHDGQQEEISDTADDQKAGNKEENPLTTTSQPLNDLDETNDQSNSTSNHNQEPERQQESKSDAADHQKARNREGHEEKRTLNPTTINSTSLNDRDETNGQPNSTSNRSQVHDGQQEEIGDTADDQKAGNKEETPLTTTSPSLTDRDETNGPSNSTNNHNQEPEGQQERKSDAAEHQKARNREEHEEKSTLNPTTTTSTSLNDCDETNDPSISTSNHKQDQDGQLEEIGDTADDKNAGNKEENPSTTTSQSLNDRDETNGLPNSTSNHKQDPEGQQEGNGDTSDDQKARKKEEEEKRTMNTSTTTSPSLNDRDETNGQANSASNHSHDHGGQQEGNVGTKKCKNDGKNGEEDKRTFNPSTTTSTSPNNRDDTNDQSNSTSNHYQDSEGSQEGNGVNIEENKKGGRKSKLQPSTSTNPTQTPMSRRKKVKTTPKNKVKEKVEDHNLTPSTSTGSPPLSQALEPKSFAGNNSELPNIDNSVIVEPIAGVILGQERNDTQESNGNLSCESSNSASYKSLLKSLMLINIISMLKIYFFS